MLGIVVLVESIKKVKAERQRWHEEWEARRRREEESKEVMQRGSSAARKSDRSRSSRTGLDP
jgi:hypothetical protein